jgi:hypothetical protein
VSSGCDQGGTYHGRHVEVLRGANQGVEVSVLRRSRRQSRRLRFGGQAESVGVHRSVLRLGWVLKEAVK